MPAVATARCPCRPRDARLGGVAFDLLAPAVAECATCLIVHRGLATGQQAHFGYEGYKLRWVSGSKVRIESTSSPNKIDRYGTGDPMGYRSIKPPQPHIRPATPPG